MPTFLVDFADATCAAYAEGALRTLCGRPVADAREPSLQEEPTCERCSKTLAEHVELGLATTDVSGTMTS